MIKIEDKKNCMACSACYNICPVKAIKMVEDNEGFKYPKVDMNKCIQCGLCNKVCPINNNTKINDNYKKPTVIAAWSKNNHVRLDSTSGGIFSELAGAIYKQNGYVCGAIYNKEWLVEHYVSSNIEDIDNLRSSKYLQSDMNDNFKRIKKLLEQGEKVLVCGCPCQIAGLYNYLSNKEYENLYTCDFICRGVNSPKIFKKYILNLQEKYHSKIKKIKFKNKTYGWHNFSIKVDFENGKNYIGTRYLDSYWIGYLQYNAFMRPSCYECKFKGLPRVADITLADFWGIEKIDPKLDCDKGTSMILINSNKGKKLFELIKDNVEYVEVTSNDAFNGNMCMNNSVEITESRKNVFKNIDKMSYNELSKNFFPEPNLKKKVKIKIKTNRTLKKIKARVKKVIGKS